MVAMAIKIYNSLPVQMKEKAHGEKKFKKFSLFKFILHSAGIF
jgi:hypothetical protein